MMATPASTALMQDLQTVLFTEEQIARKVAELGARISRDYAERDLVLIGVLKGGVVFLSDLSRAITVPSEYDLVGARSYKEGTRPSAEVTITKDLDLPIRGRDVLLVEDIYDTGNTMRAIHEMLAMYRPRSLEICSLLRKSKRRDNPMEIKYVGFEIDEVFVVGYGLDYKERYRGLRCIGVLNPESID
jgi:hypoxanthine phosphoribosyltransferase